MAGSGSDDDAFVFPVRTHFHAMARRPGGIPREQAIEAAESHLHELHHEFKEWLDQELAEIAKILPQSADEVTSDDPWVEAAHARCQAVRDTAATMGFYLVTFAANNLCEAFDTIRSGIEYPLDAIDRDFKTLLLARQEADSADRTRLQELIRRMENPSAALPPAARRTPSK
ncbi:MAG: hypothetical protein IT539_16320 [Bradyrhizobiaceae bacterium]|nr:hypothetical protein [Bradyrhizobiaceae bacterium]